MKHKKDSNKIVGLMLLLLAANTALAQVNSINKPNVAATYPAPTITPATTPAAYVSPAINYVRTWEAMGPITTATGFTTQSYTAVKQNTAYIDGLGRPLQTVMRQITPNATDMVSPVLYDAFGREQYKYMPYISTATDGTFKTDPFTQQKTFLQTQYTGEQVFYGKTDFEASPLNRPSKTYASGNSWAGSNKGVEQQYLINILANDVKIWNITSDAANYDANLPTTTAASPYAAGLLYQTKTIDENGNTMVEFKDKEGKVILKKVQVNTTIDEAYTGWLSTYYVYDDLNQLRFVIPPKAVAWLAIPINNWSFTGATGLGVANELCFRYEYDYRGRMIAKKVPGAGWVYMVYDLRDRLVFTQDANMRLNNQWLASLYDDLNRPVLTGMITYSGTQTALQLAIIQNTTTTTSVDDIIINTLQSNTKYYKAGKSITLDVGFDTDNTSNVTLEIQPGNTVAVAGENIAVNNNPLLPEYNFIPLTVTYYDNYTFNTNSAKNYATPSPALTVGTNLYSVTTPTNAQQALVPVKGMVTGTRVRTLPDPANLAAGVWLGSVIYYDDRGRVLQTYSDNYKGGTDKATNLYNFTGKVLCSRIEHSNPQNAEAALQQIKVETSMSYDHANRLLKVSKSINGATAKIIATNTYDELGQLKSKELGQSIEGMLDFTYNVRGWLKSINKDFANGVTNSGKSFGMELSYDWGFGTNQFNGNIAGTKWRTKGDKVQRSYGFGYDKVNRLLSADFAQGATYADDAVVNFDMNMGSFVSNVYTEGSAYDENGNIKAMLQYGLKTSASTIIDNLSYTYTTNSNKLKNVTEATGVNDPLTKLGDFRISQTYLTALGSPSVKPATATDYDYDVNGNLKQDLNKDIDIGSGITQGIQYNHLNLPWKINVKNKGTITYVYDAAGNKLEKITNDITIPPPGGTSGSKTTTYLSGFVYENNVLQYFGHEEGRVRVVPSTTGGASTFAYDYFIKDHLGNTRMVLTDEVPPPIIYPAATMEGTFDAATNSMVNYEKVFYKIDNTKITPETAIASWVAPAETVANTKLYYNNNGNPPTNISYPAGCTPVQTAGSNNVYKLNATTNKTGLEFMIKVMAGDKIDIFGKSYFLNTATVNNANSTPLDLTTLMANMLLSPANAAAGKGLTGTNLATINTGQIPVSFFTGANGETTTIPKAYINYIFFDEQFKYAGGNVSRVGASGTVKDHWTVDAQLQNITVPKNGYIFVYVSNESNLDVFFDNLQVIHKPGPVLEETHYYPFGLTMSGISSKAAGVLENKKQKFQGQEFASKEFSDGSGLEMYEFKWRMADPQTGRFWQVDPLSEKYVYNSTYAFSENKVTGHRELEGLEAKLAIYGIGGGGTAYKQSDLNAFQARAQALEKAGYTAVGVHNGDEFVSALKSATASEGSIQSVAVFAHAGSNGIYLNKDEGFFTDNTGPGGNAANVSDVKSLVGSGGIKFEKGATMIFDACSISKPLGNADPLGVSIAKNLEVSTVAGTDHVSPYKNIENGVFQSDGTFVRTDPVATMTPVTTTSITTVYVTGGAAMGGLPLASPITSTTTSTTNVRTVTTQQTDIGRVVDFKKY